MSLGTMLNQVIRPKIPETVFAPCLPGDRMLAENILMVTQELIPTLNVQCAVISKHGSTYIITVPSVTSNDVIGLGMLQDIQAYCPGRIQTINVLYRNDTLNLELIILNETMPITSTQLDIVRMSKKRRKS